MNSQFTTTSKIFAMIALCALLTSFAWFIKTNQDKTARIHVLQTTCDKAYANNEKANEVIKACQKDNTLMHYEDVEGFLFVTLLVSGMTSLAFIRRSE